tara:strand:+ start:130 stop:807 length:678 start_codon:yes stop_codon:yes gene_type:complete
MADRQSGIIKMHGREYKTVALRISEFRAKYPIEGGWGISTEIVSDVDGVITMKATVSGIDEGGPARVLATGYAQEVRTKRGINSTSALENCETSAIGRALAAAGFAGSEYASADELASALAAQAPRPGEISDIGKGTKARVDDARKAGHHPSFDRAERVRFMTALGNMGYLYDDDEGGGVVQFTTKQGWGSPSQWSTEDRTMFLSDLERGAYKDIPRKRGSSVKR